MEIIATAESALQAENLLRAGVDTLYIGNSRFGLRLPTSFSNAEIEEITKLAHSFGKKVIVAVNALMHNDHVKELPVFLREMDAIGVDKIAVGDPGVILMLEELEIKVPFIYDAQTFVTSAEQIDFWAGLGAVSAVLARELTRPEVIQIAKRLDIPVEVLVYGPTCIHQSKRKLVTNYYNIVGLQTTADKARGLYLREPNDADSMLPIYEDENGTHIFSTEDISMMPYLAELYDAGVTTFKLDGILMHGADFVSIAKLFVEAKEALIHQNFVAETFVNRLAKLVPDTRELGAGFYLKNPDEVK
ncbi:peptidase U32 family protein [Listeria fleischmannii]|uniref:peptidase U32 family protein n=1 Tax=Listeria fleischmannii TaxID=1069827 RepID=UPI00162A50EE|nr:peptidase U32 family protein [Listeria fleischmannii]MBC1418986.1 U32 family peptidase [Listeria fleischmannii]